MCGWLAMRPVADRPHAMQPNISNDAKVQGYVDNTKHTHRSRWISIEG